MNTFVVILCILVTVDGAGRHRVREVRVDTMEKCFEMAADFMRTPAQMGEPKHLKAGCDGELAEEKPL